MKEGEQAVQFATLHLESGHSATGPAGSDDCRQLRIGSRGHGSDDRRSEFAASALRTMTARTLAFESTPSAVSRLRGERNAEKSKQRQYTHDQFRHGPPTVASTYSISLCAPHPAR